MEKSEPVGDRLRLQVAEGALGRAVVAVEAAGGRVLAVQTVRETLEDYFFREMGGAPGARGLGGVMGRMLAVASNTFRETRA